MFKVIKDPLKYFTNLTKNQEPFNWFTILGRKCLIINDTKAIQHVFSDRESIYNKSIFHKGLEPLLGQGIFLSEGDTWKNQRRQTAPFFAGKYFSSYISQMNVSAKNMCIRIDKKIQNNEYIDIDKEFMWYTLDVVLRCLFKTEEKGFAEDLKDSLGILLKDAEGRIWDLISTPPKIKQRLSPSYRDAIKFIDDLVDKIINEKIDDGDGVDFVSVLATKYDALSPTDKKEFKDQVMSFLLAGHETSANALAWSLFELSKDPALIEKTSTACADIEIEQITPETFTILNSIKSIFEESMRLYPPVWTMSRQSISSDRIPFENGESIKISPNQIVMISPYLLHRYKKYWKNPEQFDPERFMPTNNINRSAFIPFGGGKRLCLGHKFAIFEGMIALIFILQKYDFKCVNTEKIEPKPLITLRPNTGILMKFNTKVANKKENDYVKQRNVV